MSRTPPETHPTEGFGAKSGGESAPAANANPAVNARPLNIAVMNERFDKLRASSPAPTPVPDEISINSGADAPQLAI
jgi:ribosomal protein L11